MSRSDSRGDFRKCRLSMNKRGTQPLDRHTFPLHGCKSRRGRHSSLRQSLHRVQKLSGSAPLEYPAVRNAHDLSGQFSIARKHDDRNL